MATLKTKKYGIPNNIYNKYLRKGLVNLLSDPKGFHEDLNFCIKSLDFKGVDFILNRALPSFYAAKHFGSMSYAEYWGGKKIIDLSRERREACRTRRVLAASWFRVEDSFNLIKYLKEHFSINKILDPFTGWGSRAAGAIMNDVLYHGCDMNDLLLFELQGLYEEYIKKGLISFSKQDSFIETYDMRDVDCIFTCPPYWKAEFYGYRVNLAKTYNDFLGDILQIINNCLMFQNVKVVAFCVENFWIDSKQYFFENDFVRLVENYGFNVTKKTFLNRKKEFGIKDYNVFFIIK